MLTNEIGRFTQANFSSSPLKLGVSKIEVLL